VKWGANGNVPSNVSSAAIPPTRSTLCGTGYAPALSSFSTWAIALPKTTTIPVFTQNGIGAKMAGKTLGDTVTYNGPTTVSGTAQVPFINAAIQQGYNAIVISTPDPNAVAPSLKRAAAKGIKSSPTTVTPLPARA